MSGLTAKQQAVLDFIQHFIEQHHYSPSYQEIMHHFGFRSPGSVYKYIRILQRKAVLTAEKACSRSLLPVRHLQATKQVTNIELPLIGNLSIGYPLELFVQPKSIAIPASLVQSPEQTYLLRVQGDSLQEEFMQDGDLILIEARQHVQEGEIVLGLINQHDTVLKRYYLEGMQIRLKSQQMQQQDFTVHQEHLLIQGVLVGLIRAY